ncbi:hypothetical protein EYZ11_005719 [Aspergillus tanneri]|uniref:Uncharacterized protein n=1 Tax=Aspergillus tanneri TaxID=1220188 RepID=A0A4S3JHK5_9EURO|nr:hypothetical protein EYZ11_005719 [Aspergillus tanneri]
MVCCRAPVAACQTRTVRSREPDASSRPSGEKGTYGQIPDLDGLIVGAGRQQMALGEKATD